MGGRLLHGLITVVSSSEVVLTGEVLHSRSGVLETALGVSEIVIPTDQVLYSCLDAWYHVGAFTPL